MKAHKAYKNDKAHKSQNKAQNHKTKTAHKLQDYERTQITQQ